MTRPGAADARSPLLPLIWLAMTASWLVVLVVTDWPAWPLAVWIAVSVVTLSSFREGVREARSLNG